MVNWSAPVQWIHAVMGTSKKGKGDSATWDPTAACNAVISYSNLKCARDTFCYWERDITERQNMLYISTKSWSVKNLSSKSAGEAAAWFHFEARLKYKLLRQLVVFHHSRSERPWTYRNLSRRVKNIYIYILVLCQQKKNKIKKRVNFRSLRQNSESIQANSCWEMGGS